jgi:hypothetical protein
MTISGAYRFTATILVLGVALYSVGVPVTVYMCPMMSADSPSCEMSVPSFGNIPSIANEAPACCAKYIVAEGHSTPYLKFENPKDAPLSVAIIAAVQSGEPRHGWSEPLVQQDAGPPGSDPPLYILKSALLI